MVGKRRSNWSFRATDLEIEAVEAELQRLRARHPEAQFSRSDALRCLILRGDAAARDTGRALTRMMQTLERDPGAVRGRTATEAA